MNSDAKRFANDNVNEDTELVPLASLETNTNDDPPPPDRVDGIVTDLLAENEVDEAKAKTSCYEGNKKKLVSALVVVVILLPLVTKLLCGGVDVDSTMKDLDEFTAFSLHPNERNDSRAPNDASKETPSSNVNETDTKPSHLTRPQRVSRTDILDVNETGAFEPLGTNATRVLHDSNLNETETVANHPATVHNVSRSSRNLTRSG